MKTLQSILIMLIVTVTTVAQAPEKISYQAVVRNSADKLIANHVVGMRISILQTIPTGTVVYKETQTTTTNVNGLVSIQIGAGTTTDVFSSIDWSKGPYFIKTEIDPAGGTAYSITDTSQLLSVPYALYAKDVKNKQWAESGSSIYYNTGKVGIGGVNLSDANLHIKTSGSETARFESTAPSNWISFYTSGVRKGMIWLSSNMLTLRSDDGGVSIKTNGNNERLTIEDDGDITTPLTGSNNNIVPVAYGYVNQMGELNTTRSTNNVSSTRTGSSGTYNYIVTVTGASFFIALVTPAGDYTSFPRVTYISNTFSVDFMSYNGNAGQANNFSFVVFAP